MAVIGVDLGAAKVAAALMDETGEIYSKTVHLLHNATGTAIGDIVVEAIVEIMRANTRVPIRAIGICVPGIVHSDTDTVWVPNIHGWESYELRSHIAKALSPVDIPIIIESDRTCSIMGEYWRGAARNHKNAIYVAVGAGIGAGIMIDGHILRGSHDIAGAIGWMALQHPYEPEYIPTGCFEYYASGNGIATQARRALRCEHNYTGVLSVRPIEAITSYDVFAAYDMGDAIANKVLGKAIEMWGMAGANLVSIFNPEIVVFGGGIFGPAKRFMRNIYDEACKWGQPKAMKQVEFCASAIDGDAALFGAAYLAAQHQHD